MFPNFIITMFFVFIFLLFQIFVFRVSGFKCFTTMSSTCPKNVITSWNTNDNMADNLMKWIKSVTFEQTSKNEASGKHCKTITIKENDFFSQMAPEIYSPNITMFGKVSHNDDGKNWQPSQRVFVGPIWATLNDQFEWIVENENGMKAMLSTEALIHNGLYYGTIDNDDLNLGKL